VGAAAGPITDTCDWPVTVRAASVGRGGGGSVAVAQLVSANAAASQSPPDHTRALNATVTVKRGRSQPAVTFGARAPLRRPLQRV
jgi:hypothetical protein